MSAFHRTLRKVIRPAVMRALLAWERIESGVNYDPTSPKIKANPYEKYRKLRALDPVHRIRLINGWVLTEYEDVDEVLRDHRRFSRDYGSESEYKSLLDLDPPDHTRVRSLVSKAFTPRSVAELHPRIQQIVDDLLDGVADNDRFDLVESFAYPLPGNRHCRDARRASRRQRPLQALVERHRPDRGAYRQRRAGRANQTLWRGAESTTSTA